MSSLASVLKSEIARLARKEIRAANATLVKSMTRQRTEISELKKRVKVLEGQLARSQAALASQVPLATALPPADPAFAPVRVTPKSMRAHRKRVGLSAENYAKILGVSMQTVYHWEQGKSRPRQSQMERLGAVRRMGKREAMKQLALVKQAAAQKKSAKKVAKKTTKSKVKKSS